MPANYLAFLEHLCILYYVFKDLVGANGLVRKRKSEDIERQTNTLLDFDELFTITTLQNIVSLIL